MNILLVTLDSKFIHANLAVRYLKKFCENDKHNIEIKEFTINQQIDYILNEIFECKPHVICFSCYIWNIEYIKEIAYIIKEAEPTMKILCGGPEVSFETEKFMEKAPYIDYVIMGEGEITFKEFIDSIHLYNDRLSEIKGLAYILNGKIMLNEKSEQIDNLDIINYPYEEYEEFDDKIIYYESSRGCPFSCAFCMSSIDKRTRYFSLERVKKDLSMLLKTKAKQIKFVDRTFNADYKRSMEIMKYIVLNNINNMTIHFEITADIINEEFMMFLKDMPVNMFQFEIGVQSLNNDTLCEINRHMNIDKLYNVISNIRENNNIHMHLDLIAGLPYENYESFKNSFNGIHKLYAEKIQLGFLKVLKGTKIYDDMDKHGIKYRQIAPYEVICTKYISIKELLKLKKIEHIVDKYYNEKYFVNSLNYIIDNFYFESPFDFYEDFSEYWQRNSLFKVSHSRKKLYEILYNYMVESSKLTEKFADDMRYDYVFNNQYEEIPKYLNREYEDDFKNIKKELANDEKFRDEYFKDANKNDKIINSFRLVKINGDLIAFIFNNKDNIFDRCKTYNINHLVKGNENE